MKTSPPETPAEAAHGHRFTWLLWLAFLVLVVYPLSTGPAAWLVDKFPALTPFLEPLYAPIQKMCEHCPLLRELAWWYLGSVWHVPLPIYK